MDIIESATSIKLALKNLMDKVINDTLQTDCPKGCFKVNAEVEVAADDEIVNKLVYEDDLVIEEALHKAFKAAQQNAEIAASKDPLALARFFY